MDDAGVESGGGEALTDELNTGDRGNVIPESLKIIHDVFAARDVHGNQERTVVSGAKTVTDVIKRLALSRVDRFLAASGKVQIECERRKGQGPQTDDGDEADQKRSLHDDTDPSPTDARSISASQGKFCGT